MHTEIKRIISVEELNTLSPENLIDIMTTNLGYNDYENAKIKNLKYRDKNKAVGLESVLYYCPKCHKEYSVETNGNTVYCKDCGFSVDINEQYSFNENELGLKNIHEWYELIKEYERNNLKQDLNLSCEVDIVKFNFTDSKLNEKGSGVCTLTKEGFKYEGDLKVKSFEIPINSLPALAFSCNEEFECYYDNELYYFYPKQNRKQCTKWALMADVLNCERESYEKYSHRYK